MLDIKLVNELVEKEVTHSVNQYVASILADHAWQTQIENRITGFVKDRIASKFANITSLPELVETVQGSVLQLFSSGQVPGIDQYIDHTIIKQSIDTAVQQLVTKTIDNLVIDNEWIKKVEVLVNQQMSQRVLDKLSGIDINSVIVTEIDNGIDRWQDRLLTKFRSNGITDIASECQLTVLDGAVVIANGVTAKNALIENDLEVKGTVTVDNLIVKKIVNTDSLAWEELSNTIADKTKDKLTDDWNKSLIKQVLDVAKNDGINFSKVLINDESLVDGAVLNSSITDTNIQKLGSLRSLTVDGTATFNNTFSVRNNRVGINTNSPEMALSVWDEEVSLVAGKLEKNKAFFGTNRKQGLSIGTNRQGYIDITDEGLVIIKQLRIDRFKLGHATTVPGWEGSKGDFMLNSDYKNDSAFAWVCLGGHRWQPLKSA
jgi:hypothetical protein